jgi:2-enoate reductase
MAPMGYCLDNFSPRARDYFIERAKGGAALIVVPVFVTEALEDHGMIALFRENEFDDLVKLLDAVHAYDTKLCLQLIIGLGRALPLARPGEQSPSASVLPTFKDPNVYTREMTIADIKVLQEGFRKTAVLAKKAGIDAVELHAYGGYLPDQFLTPRWNKRTDEYGGDLKGRARFLLEFIDIVKEVFGNDFPLLIKYTPVHYAEGEGFRTIEEGVELSRMLEKAGVHLLHVDAGCYENWYLCMPPIYLQEQTPQLRSAEQVKQAVSVPVAADGKLGDIEKAEAALQQGKVDFLIIGRGLLADPHLPNKLREGRTDDITPCIGCNEGCLAQVMLKKPISCAVNPTVGREATMTIKKADTRKKVLIIGGGPGGLSAAIDASKAGHDVELWEKTSRLGGYLIPAGRPTFKQEINALLAYYRAQIYKLRIKVKLCKEATVEAVLAAKADVVILATGSEPVRPVSMPGIDAANVVTAIDALLDMCTLGQNIVMIGAGIVGCETALHLTPRGKKITLVEMQPTILPESMFIQNKTMLSLAIQRDTNITVYTDAKLVRVEKTCAVVEKDGKELSIPCDTVVLAMGLKPKNPLAEQLSGKLRVINIGDCVEPRRILETISEARRAVISL